MRQGKRRRRIEYFYTFVHGDALARCVDRAPVTRRVVSCVYLCVYGLMRSRDSAPVRCVYYSCVCTVMRDLRDLP